MKSKNRPRWSSGAEIRLGDLRVVISSVDVDEEHGHTYQTHVFFRGVYLGHSRGSSEESLIELQDFFATCYSETHADDNQSHDGR